MKYPEIIITNPKLLRCYKNGKNHEPLNNALGDRFGNSAEWGFYFLFRAPFFSKDTKQHAINISIPKNCKDSERIKEELLAIAPHLLLTEEGYGRIKVSEHTNSEHGTYTIIYYPKDNRWAIQKHVHYVDTKEFMSLDILVKSLKTKYYRYEPGIDEEVCPDCIDGVVQCTGDEHNTEVCTTCWGIGFREKEDKE